MTDLKILSVNVSDGGEIDLGGKKVVTGFVKTPRTDSIRITALGLEGDFRGPARRLHDTALCVFPSEHYDHFQRCLGRELPPGSFGENLTTWGLIEEDIQIGDEFHHGDLKLQVSAPRTPCKKLNVMMQARFSGYFLETKKVGFYLRVLSPGRLRAGEAWRHVKVAAPSTTVADYVQNVMVEYWDEAAIERCLAAPGLADEEKERLAVRLAHCQRVVGWAGLRRMRLEVLERDSRSGMSKVQLSCLKQEPLPPLDEGQVITLLHRPGTFESRLRFRSVPVTAADLSGAAPSIDSSAGGALMSYVARFRELPEQLLSRGEAFVAAPI